LNIKTQHAIKSDFDTSVQGTLIFFSDLEINQIKIACRIVSVFSYSNI